MTGPAVLADHRADVGVFLARVIRLDPAGLVRVRPAGAAHLTLWSWLPLDALAARTVAGSCPDDATVTAADLLSFVSGPEGAPPPRRRDAQWRGSLPPERGWRRLDEIPADVIGNLVAAGERAFRVTGGSAKAAGEALLDHETLRVNAEGSPAVAIPFRLLLALARMAFLGDHPVAVAVAGSWLRLTAPYGVLYRRTDALGVGGGLTR